MITTQELFSTYQIKTVTKPKGVSEYSDLVKYFLDLKITDKKGKIISAGAISFFLSPFVRGSKTERNYSLLYALRTKCQNSNNPIATFWTHVKHKAK